MSGRSDLFARLRDWMKRGSYSMLTPKVRLGLMKAYYLTQHRRRAGAEPEMHWFEPYVQPGDCVLDIGANVGFYTVRLSERVGPRGTVHAFEPVPETFAILSHVVNRLPLPNVVLHGCALADREGSAEMAIPREAGGAENLYLAHLVGTDPSTGRRARVETVTLDGLRTRGLPRVSFIKCDVEGAELQVLVGGQSILAADRPVVLCEVGMHSTRFRASQAQVFGLMKDMGYHALRLGSNALVACDGPIPDVENYFFIPA